MENIQISQIQQHDNSFLADIIRTSLKEFGANHAGTVYYDDTTDHLFELFQKTGSVYYVLKDENGVLGGAGIYPSDGLPESTCELVKMYLKKTSRGTGLGKKLMNCCIEFARENGYKKLYLETMPELKDAIGLYTSFCFQHLTAPLGDTGHYGCKVWMTREI